MYTDPTGHCIAPTTQWSCPFQVSSGPAGWASLALEAIVLIAVAAIGNEINSQALQHSNDFINLKENKNRTITQIINSYRSPHPPPQNQKKPEPPKDDWLDEIAKAVKAACAKNRRLCIGTGIVAISSTLIGIDEVTGDPNPFHCSSNPSHPACQGATGTPTPTISPTNTLAPSPTNTMTPSPSSTSTSTPTNTITPPPINTSTPYPISPYYNSPNILMR
jgi:hypothetical protein